MQHICAMFICSESGYSTLPLFSVEDATKHSLLVSYVSEALPVHAVVAHTKDELLFFSLCYCNAHIIVPLSPSVHPPLRCFSLFLSLSLPPFGGKKALINDVDKSFRIRFATKVVHMNIFPLPMLLV